MTSWTEARERQTEALRSLGFEASFIVGGGGPFAVAQYFATCSECGAAVALCEGVGDNDQPTTRHRRWHEAQQEEKR